MKLAVSPQCGRPKPLPVARCGFFCPVHFRTVRQNTTTLHNAQQALIMTFSVWLIFLGASLLLSAAPGPDNLFVLAQSAVYGVRAGVTVVFGLMTGLVLQTFFAACGLAAVVAAVPALFMAIKLAGAAYLLYLAWGAWTHAADPVGTERAVELSPVQLWRRGLIMNITNLPLVLKNIFVAAFDFKAIFGGFAGSCMMWGIKRGLYSNEAGMGSAPNAAASADVSHPVKQGLVQMLSVFIDTLLVCTATAMMCMCANPEGLVADAAGAAYVQQSMQLALGDFGPIFIAVAMSLFAFTTLIGNYYYTEGCLKFILKRTPSKAFMLIFRLIATALVFVGALLSAGIVWDTADMLQAFMVIINVPVIIIIAKPALAALKDYMSQRKEGKDPVFKSSNIGLKGKTECWED